MKLMSTYEIRDSLIAIVDDDHALTYRELEARADATFFLSWNWIGCWIEETGLRPAILPDGEIVVTQQQEHGQPPDRGSFALVRDSEGWKTCVS